MVDTYINLDILYPDTKVAEVLAIGGPVKYELMEGYSLADEWILNNIGAHISKVFPEKGIVIVLGKALIWSICDKENLLDAIMVTTVCLKY